MEVVQLGRELRAVLAQGPADQAAFAHHRAFVELHLRQHRRPHLRLPVVDDDVVEQPDVEHLHHVLVFQLVGHGHQLDRRLAVLGQALVQRHQAVVVARGPAHMHRLARQRLGGGHRRGLGPAEHDLAVRLGIGRRDEVDELPACIGHRQVAGGDVAHALGHALEQFVARGRHQVQRDRPLAQLRLVLLVQVLLEGARRLGGDAAFAALVVVEQRAAERHQHADVAAFEHAVEIAGPGTRLGGQRAQLGGGGRGRRRRLGCHGTGGDQAGDHDQGTQEGRIHHGVSSMAGRSICRPLGLHHDAPATAQASFLPRP